ncbi:hypothetical protein TNCV_3541081 [Trichonephila clavipes]|nr:hypothetical protein TNCV_3541081 [Trichonephila clavipes]
MSMIAFPAISLDWLLKRHSTPHAFLGLGSCVDVMSHARGGGGLAANVNKLSVYVGSRFIGSCMYFYGSTHVPSANPLGKSLSYHSHLCTTNPSEEETVIFK